MKYLKYIILSVLFLSSCSNNSENNNLIKEKANVIDIIQLEADSWDIFPVLLTYIPSQQSIIINWRLPYKVQPNDTIRYYKPIFEYIKLDSIQTKALNHTAIEDENSVDVSNKQFDTNMRYRISIIYSDGKIIEFRQGPNLRQWQYSLIEAIVSPIIQNIQESANIEYFSIVGRRLIDTTNTIVAELQNKLQQCELDTIK